MEERGREEEFGHDDLVGRRDVADFLQVKGLEPPRVYLNQHNDYDCTKKLGQFTFLLNIKWTSFFGTAAQKMCVGK